MIDTALSVIDFLFRFFPRLDVVSEKEAGVAWVRGKAREIKPGTLFIYWPLWTEVEYIELYPDPIDLPTQALTLKKDRIAVSGVVEWRVKNTMLALNRRDVVEKIRCQAMAAVRNALFGQTLDSINRDESAIEAHMRADLQQSMRGYGVKIEQLYFSDITTCNTHLHIGAAGPFSEVD